MRLPKHIGILPDGNRRWAENNGLSKEKGYNIDLLSRTSDYRKNCDYVDMRNKYVHPDHNMDAAEALAELGNIKKQTTSRLGWLIKATEQSK